MQKQDDQKLIDICFQVGLVIHMHKMFDNMTNDEVAEWIATQLRTAGYDTKPRGSSYGVLC